MKVLHIHSGNLYGGVESMLALLARRRDLVPDMAPEFAFSHRGAAFDSITSCGAIAHDLGVVRTRNPFSVRRGRAALRALVRERTPEVIVFHSFWAHAIFGSVCRSEAIPFATWVHDLTDGRHWLERWSARTPPDRFITSSEFIAKIVRDRYPSTQTTAIHCPVDIGPGARAERSDGSIVIVQVGRLQEWKGHRLLLDALGALKDLPEWRCRIVGGVQRDEERDYLEELKRYAEGLGIGGRVDFMGQRSDVASILGSSDIYCQVNHRPEPFGIAIVEAMLAGLPVVTAAMGGALEIVDPRSGVLVDPRKPEQLTNALRELISSRRVREVAGAHGAKRAADLTDPGQQMQRIADALVEMARPGS